VGKVTASLDTSHYKGPLVKVVTVKTNEPGSAAVVLTLKADVTTLVDVSPTETPTIRMSLREPKPMELTVAAADGQPFDVLAVETDGKVDVSIAPAPGAAPATPKAKAKKPAGKPPVAAGATRYLVRLTPKKDAPVGFSSSMVNLTTTVKGAETVPIRVAVFVAGRVQVTPTYLGLRPSAEPPVLHLKVQATKGDGFQVLGVEASDPDFTAVATPVHPGREYDVTIRYGGKPGRGRVAARIAVRTNEPGQESIVVPLEGQL